ncbi:hypothetical protein [Rheinheimera sp.]|uniref:hypothetical protein n=1 Tax=Rheinheimera sp. TaxID=1869214 RepID=UPI0040472E55
MKYNDNEIVVSKPRSGKSFLVSSKEMGNLAIYRPFTTPSHQHETPLLKELRNKQQFSHPSYVAHVISLSTFIG